MFAKRLSFFPCRCSCRIQGIFVENNGSHPRCFRRGDVPAILALHHPDVIKYFGGDNVVKGRAALGKGLSASFKTSKWEFVENRIESTVFNGEAAVEVGIFTIKIIPKNGAKPVFALSFHRSFR